ncbi:cytokine-dependent hematopoietic cell linker isoform X3 [Mastomys coucha]|uniref:cytokine-dependent hematopoietic cell linker isoform X3 n=1 Tax=Mastomys coucha TaxID=35658 RepID=UPI001262480C|nr:cytokine-dependent hematopoietic cell linker isoform X3 [Mastomys coucha]
MTSQGNKRTTKEGFGDLRFQNVSLLKNRSWPRLSSAKGRCWEVLEPFPDHRRNLAVVPDGEKCSSNNDYEDPELQLLKAWPSMKILPARPIQESEYADTRYLKDTMEAPLLLSPKASVSTERQARDVWMKQQNEVGKPTSKDVRSQHFKGFKYTRVNKTPLPPPRPAITLPKKYQPLPPAPPEESSAYFPPKPTFQEVQRGPRQRSTKDFSKVLGVKEESHHQTKPESSCPSPNQNTQKSPPAIASSSYVSGRRGIQARDHTGIPQHCPPQRCQAAASYSLRMMPYENTNSEKPVPTKPDEKDIWQNEWYIGEYNRQTVEEVLMKENKTFDSVEDIIEHYTYFPILLIDGKDKAARREQCYLTQPLPLARLLLTQYSSQALPKEEEQCEEQEPL